MIKEFLTAIQQTHSTKNVAMAILKVQADERASRDPSTPPIMAKLGGENLDLATLDVGPGLTIPTKEVSEDPSNYDERTWKMKVDKADIKDLYKELMHLTKQNEDFAKLNVRLDDEPRSTVNIRRDILCKKIAQLTSVTSTL